MSPVRTPYIDFYSPRVFCTAFLKVRALGKLLTFGAAVILLWSCSAGDTASAGKTSETTNGFSVLVTDADGRPAENCDVYLVARTDWSSRILAGISPVLDTFTTDNGGRTFIDTSGAGSAWNLEIVRDSEGMVMSSGDIPPAVNDVALQLSSLSAARAGLISDSLPVERVLIHGTSFASPVSSQRQFSFEKIPSGGYSLFAFSTIRNIPQLAPMASFRVGTAADKTLDTLVVEQNTILLEDFEDRDPYHFLGQLAGEGRWFTADDKIEGGNSRVISPLSAGPDDFPAAVVATGAFKGRSLYFQYSLGGALTYPYSEIGMDFGGKVLNLSGLDTLQFQAKGSGQLEVAFTILLRGKETWVNREMTLAASWKSFKVSTDSLLNPDKTPADWQALGGAVLRISFMGLSGDYFYLDEIRLVGLDVGEVFR